MLFFKIKKGLIKVTTGLVTGNECTSSKIFDDDEYKKLQLYRVQKIHYKRKEEKGTKKKIHLEFKMNNNEYKKQEKEKRTIQNNYNISKKKTITTFFLLSFLLCHCVK